MNLGVTILGLTPKCYYLRQRQLGITEANRSYMRNDDALYMMYEVAKKWHDVPHV